MRRPHNLPHEISSRGGSAGVFGLLALVGGLLIAPAPASAVPSRAVRQCKKSCSTAKSLCISQVHDHLKTLLGDCTGSGPEKRHCHRNALDTAKGDRTACSDFKKTCNTCCGGDGTDCDARCGDGTVTPGHEDCDPPGSACGDGGICGAD